MTVMRTIIIHPRIEQSPMQHDRKHDLNTRETAGVSAEDRSGERKPGLSARSLAARGEAPDGSEDGPSESEAQGAGPTRSETGRTVG